MLRVGRGPEWHQFWLNHVWRTFSQHLILVAIFNDDTHHFTVAVKRQFANDVDVQRLVFAQNRIAIDTKFVGPSLPALRRWGCHPGGCGLRRRFESPLRYSGTAAIMKRENPGCRLRHQGMISPTGS